MADQTTQLSLDGISVVEHLLEIKTIFFHNLFIGIVIYIAGYLTFGLATFIITVWNGVLFALSLNLISNRINADLLVLFSHAPIEIAALCCFGALGLAGFPNFKLLLNNEEISFISFFNVKKLLFPTLLLFMAAVMEVLIPYYFL